MSELLFIINSIFFGFSIINIAIVIGRFLTKRPELGKKLLDVADGMIVWTGILFAGYVVYYMAFTLLLLENANSTLGEEVVLTENGPYSLFLAHLMTLVLGSQLFWFERFKLINAIRIVIGILMLIAVKFEDFVIITTSLHRDYLLPGQSFFRSILIDCSLEFITFLAVFFLVYMITKFGRK